MLLFCFAIFSSGCVTFPESAKQVVSDDGMLMNRVGAVGGFTWLSSGFWMPGDSGPQPRIPSRVGCVTPQMMMLIEWRDVLVISRANALRLCHLALDSAQYVQQFRGQSRVGILPLVYLVPPRIGMEQKSFSFYPFGPLRPVFAFRYYRLGKLTAASLVDGVAHELFHIFTKLGNSNIRASANERLAYRVGSCAQLEVNGGILLESVSTANVPKDMTDLSVRESMRAARDLYESLLLHVDEDGWIRKSSVTGQQMLQDCRSDLAQLFQL